MCISTQFQVIEQCNTLINLAANVGDFVKLNGKNYIQNIKSLKSIFCVIFYFVIFIDLRIDGLSRHFLEKRYI